MTRIKDSVETNYSYDQVNRLLEADNITYSWDNNGNLTASSDDNTTYEYDYENRLIGASSTEGLDISFEYYPNGRKLSETSTSGDTSYSLYDNSDLFVQLDSIGVTNKQFTSTSYKQWISLRTQNESQFYHQDGLGSVVATTSNLELITAFYKYDAYGNPSVIFDLTINNITYAGNELIADLEFYYYGARFYSPKQGRFISQDPAGFVDSDNLYKYALNNPINYRDYQGYFALSALVGTAIIGAGVGVAAQLLSDVIAGERSDFCHLCWCCRSGATTASVTLVTGGTGLLAGAAIWCRW